MTAVLDRLTQLETYREYLNALSPGQLIVLYLREAYGWSFHQIGDYLGITHQAAAIRLNTAGQRLLAAYPHLRADVEDRTHRAYRRIAPDQTLQREQRVLAAIRHCNGHGPPNATALAKQLGMDPRTVNRAIRSLIAQDKLHRGQRTRAGYPLYLVDQEDST